MSHETQSLTISQEEASRVEDAAKRRLLASRKLSLVVDLDQTIIHAAVDPTIDEWKKDPDNPNHDAVKDVRQFQLKDDGPSMRGCWYYIKLRPGLMEFLERISKLYELHIYTMGTRQYAQKIAEIVDEERRYFGDRILSRDESGSMTAKSLQRLFPVDTKMVVIIDDRGDVWKWNENLVKVAPFDFFVGIGDINSSFLPKKQEIQTGDEADKAVAPVKIDGEKETDGTASSGTEGKNSALEQLVAMGGGDDPNVRELQTENQEAAIASQVTDKPLLQMQKKLDEEDEAAAAAEEASSASSSESQDTPMTGSSTAPTLTNGTDNVNGHTPDGSSSLPAAIDNTLAKTPTPTPSVGHHRHSLLHNDDRELVYLEKALTMVHRAFYAEYDRRRMTNKGGRVATLAGKRKVPLSHDSDEPPSDLILVPDVKTVMPTMKKKVLDGVHIVFSGVLPLHTDVQNADISVWARSFGANIDLEIKKRTTHLIAARQGTAKVKQALKRKNIKVVTLRWLLQCFSEWRKVNENDYLLDGEKSSNTSKLKEEADEEELLHAGLSSSEDDSDMYDLDRESDASSRKIKRPRLNTDIPEDSNDTTTDDGEEPQPLSPLDLDAAERNDIDQELKDFLGSDIDTDSEAESISSTPSTSRLPTRKRKRDGTATDDNTDTEDPSNPALTSNVARRSGIRNAIRPAAAEAASFNTVPATVLHMQTPDNDETMAEQADVEGEEREEEAEEEDSDDELARELERELEEDDDDDDDEDLDGAEGFMGSEGEVNDMEEGALSEKRSRDVERWDD